MYTTNVDISVHSINTIKINFSVYITMDLLSMNPKLMQGEPTTMKMLQDCNVMLILSS